MNEITTEERLRIVEELNRTANDSLGGESLQRALARITGAEDTSWRGVMRRVAELAYRPTTQVQVAPDGRYHCFACGHVQQVSQRSLQAATARPVQHGERHEDGRQRASGGKGGTR